MLDKICAFLTQKIRKEMPDIDDEKAEVINYGLQNLFGEIPKTFIMLFAKIYCWNIASFWVKYSQKYLWAFSAAGSAVDS